MKRRKFTQAVMAVVSIASLPIGMAMATQTARYRLENCKSLTSKDGLKLKLNQKVHPLKNKDNKQFILTYDVKNSIAQLEEKIYAIKTTNGKIHQVYMTPVGENQLQAVFNLRLNA